MRRLAVAAAGPRRTFGVVRWRATGALASPRLEGRRGLARLFRQADVRSRAFGSCSGTTLSTGVSSSSKSTMPAQPLVGLCVIPGPEVSTAGRLDAPTRLADPRRGEAR